MKKLFLFLLVLILFPSWSLKSEESKNSPSTCQALYWYKIYNELAEKLRYLSVLAGKSNLPPCSGYFGSGYNGFVTSETKIKNFKSQISYGDMAEWTYDPMKKGRNNGIYCKDEKRPHASIGRLYWSSNEPIWQDRAGGKTGIYDEGIDVIVYDGGQNCPYPLKNRDKGFSDGSIYYFDNNLNDKWDADEEVWQDSVCHEEIGRLASALSGAIYSLCENSYVDPDFNGGNFTGIGWGDIPYLLKKDANGNYAQNSRIKLFPDRIGEDAYRFTQIPSYLPDGTKIADTPVYSSNTADFYCSEFIFPVFFDEVRQILNRNILKSAWTKNPNWTSNGENNMKSGVANNKNSVNEAYLGAVNNYNASSEASDKSPYACAFYRKYNDYSTNWENKYAASIYRNYSYLGLSKSFNGLQLPKFNADFYIYATANGVFNDNGNILTQDKWCRFAQEFQCADINVKKIFGGSLNPPQISDSTQNSYEEGYSSYGAILMNYDISPYNIPPFEESYPASDTNRDDLYDTGIDLHDINNGTGTIVHSPDMDEPQVVLPLRWNSPYTNSLQYPEYVSSGGIQDKRFTLTTEQLEGMQSYFSIPSPRSDDIWIPLCQSSQTYLFLDLLMDDADKNIHMKRIGVVRPRGQVVLFDFPWDASANKFSDIGIPLGIHSKRTYRLIRKEIGYDYFKSGVQTVEVYSHYFLQFDSGISHDYKGDRSTHDFIDTSYYDDLGQIFTNKTIGFNSLEFSSKNSNSIWNDGSDYFYGIEMTNVNEPPAVIHGFNYDIDYEWNDEALLSKLIYKTKDGKNNVEVSLEYDANRKIRKLKKKVPENLAIDGKTEYEITVEGNTITYPDGTSSAKNQTDNVGRARTTVISKNIRGTGEIESTYKYNSDDLVSSIKKNVNGSSNETTYTYYSGDEKFPNTSKKCQKMKSIAYPDNSWKYYEYNANGWISRSYSPFGNEPLPVENPAANKYRHEEYSYGPHGYDCPGYEVNEYTFLHDMTEVIADSKNIWEYPRTIVKYANGLEIARSYRVINLYRWWGDDQDIVSVGKTCTAKNASWNDPSNLTNTEVYQTWGCIYGLVLLSSESPTQRISANPEMWLYGEIINPDSDIYQDARTNLNNTLKIYSKNNIKLSSMETVTNPGGTTCFKKVTDEPSSKAIESSISTTDSFGRITSTTHIDGTTETFSDYCLYGPTKYIDGNGNITIYAYNAIGQIIQEETPVAAIARTFDALGNVTLISTAPKGKGETKAEAWTYDSMSRITSHTDSVGKTTYAYSGTTTVINYPDGTDQTIKKNLDGSTASVYGSAVSPVSYDYGVDPAKGSWVKEMRGATWTITYYNMLGQGHRTETSTGYWTQNTYDNAGRPNGSYDSEGRASSTVYNAKNEISQQTVNGVTTDFTNTVTQKNGKNVFQNISTVHNSTGNIIRVNESAVTGWEQWDTVNGKTTHVVTAPKGAGNYTTLTTDFEGNISTEEISRKSNSSNINGVATITSEYDGLGRTISTQDSRKPNANTFTYRPKTDQIASATSSDGSKSSCKYSSGKYEPSSFIPTGESKSLGLKYTGLGSLEKITGSGVFDASNIFDDLNRQTGLNTKGEAGPALTSLVYDEASSRLKEKWIAGQKCYEFEYETDGRIKTFKKNISGTDAVKNMLYTPAPNFFYSGYTWSDGTPSVTIGDHDSFGQPETISTGGVCTHEFSYNPDSQILSVKFASNLTGNNNISYGYQNLRRSQMTSGNNVVNYTYESGRLKKITSDDIESEYSYVPQSVNLIDKITIKKGGSVALIRDIDWQTNADRISSVTNKSDSGQIYNSFTYDYNPKGKITKIAREGGTERRYSYDDRGQLKNAARYLGNVKLAGDEFAYLSDSIGNILYGGRKKMDGSKSVQFAPNVFNNINTRIVGNSLEVSGSVTPDATVPENAAVTVSVNNAKAALKDNAFSVTVDANNLDSAVFKSLNVVGVFFAPEEVPEVGGGQSGNVPGTDVVATVNGSVLIPKASENPVYDLGGRLVSTSLWNYSWNSEDRLISVESCIGTEPQRHKVEFAYDHAGRRIKKSVFQKSSPTGNWSLITDHFFYYDQVLLNGQPADFGVLTAEKIVNHETHETHELQYLWGLDINGSYQGLGGNGGLLCVIEKGRDGSPSRPFFPLMDAKGTIYGYIDKNGSQVAKFAYDPYGKITSSSVASDCSPDSFSFTFQSKYYDSELQCYYFGFRYYDPATCRWLNRDPLEESGGLNLYAYCDNDPVNGMDYLGLALYAFDGTANVETDRTNVFLMSQAYGKKAEYYRGVGNDIENDPVDATAGKAMGFNYQATLKTAYNDLIRNFKNGDTDIDIIGFSRGGVMAVLFAKMIGDNGVPTGEEQLAMSNRGTYKINVKAYPKIRFLGLFDPVPGPKGFPIPSNISNNVEKTAIAYSLNEMRSAFHPLLVSGSNIIQRGFAGGHSDIGGGYKNRGLANISLAWMVSQGASTGAPFNMPNMSDYPELTSRMIPHQEYSMFDIGGVGKTYDFDIRRRYLPKDLQFDPVPGNIREFYLNFEKQFAR